MLIERRAAEAAVRRTLRDYPVCALLGPRQCGKTTLARRIGGRSPRTRYFDLESAEGRGRLSEPELALSGLEGLVVIDEIQRMPTLFATLRPLADRRPLPARFLILGSAAPDLVRGVSESLAGRVGFVDLGGFDVRDTGPAALDRLWLRGGFPPAFLARDDGASVRWRRDFLRAFLERDIPQLGIRIPSETLRRFWQMLAHTHGGILNLSELGRSLGVTDHTVSRYLDVLAGTYVVRRLPPWFENISKRQTKAPKIYVRDSGLLHSLLSIESREALEGHPKLGASWEGFALEQVLSLASGREAYYWGTHAGAELDLLLIEGDRRIGVEFKRSDSPSMTKSLGIAMEDLRLDQAWIIHPGRARYPVHKRVEAVPLVDLPGLFRRRG